MRRICLLLTAVVLTACVPTAAGAQGLGPAPMMGRGHERMFGEGGAMMLPLVLKHAQLTAEQTKQVQAIMETDRQTLRALFNQLETANAQLTDKLFKTGVVQAADLTPEVQRIGQLRQQLMEQGIKTALSIRAVLTPQQLAQVSQLKDRIEKLHAEMRSIYEGND